MSDLFRLADDLGPARIIHVYQPDVELKGFLVVDNTAAGPALGGVRMAPDVGVEECFRLARAMTLKNAAAGLAHGGGKAALVGDPAMPRRRKERLIRAFARALEDIHDYIFAPDMGTDEECMAWVRDEIGRVVGLPREVGGIPLDEVGATGFGLAHAAEVASEYCDLDLRGARYAVQGFGAVGKHAARFLAERGALLVGASDSRGAVTDPNGLDVEALMTLKAEGRSVADLPGGGKIDRDGLIDVDCEIWIPAARPDVIDEHNQHRLRARMVLQGANIPVTRTAEEELHHRGVLCVPDFIANAGGVICAAAEYQRATETAAFQAISEKIRANTRHVLEEARKNGILPRDAALALARGRVRKAQGWTRWASEMRREVHSPFMMPVP